MIERIKASIYIVLHITSQLRKSENLMKGKLKLAETELLFDGALLLTSFYIEGYGSFLRPFSTFQSIFFMKHFFFFRINSEKSTNLDALLNLGAVMTSISLMLGSLIAIGGLLILALFILRLFFPPDITPTQGFCFPKPEAGSIWRCNCSHAELQVMLRLPNPLQAMWLTMLNDEVKVRGSAPLCDLSVWEPRFGGLTCGWEPGWYHQGPV